MSNTVRDLLLSLGMGDLNATLTIRYAFMAPSTTDPSMPPVILLVKHIQQRLVNLGAPGVVVSGRIDNATAGALEQISGNDWLGQPWWQVVTDLLKASAGGFTFQQPSASYGGNTPAPTGGLGDVIDSYPGGALGLAATAAGVWYFLFNKKRSA